MDLSRLENLRLKIVIVEASEHLRTMLSVMVRPIKGEVYLAADADAGFALAKLVKPDLIIADYGLDESGAMLCHRIREDVVLGKTPFVMLSAFAAHFSRGKYQEAGCDQVVHKPFRCMDLFAAIKVAMVGSEGDDRIIPVMYRNGECDLIAAGILDQLIKTGEIDCFRRRDGLVFIGRDQVRGGGPTGYEGQERRCLAV